PAHRLRGSAVITALAPGQGFPGTLPWPGTWKTFGTPWFYASYDEANVFDEFGNPLKLVSQDAMGKTRIIWSRTPVKQITITLKNTLMMPASNQRVRLELPRSLGTLDRGALIALKADERIELLHGPGGS